MYKEGINSRKGTIVAALGLAIALIAAEGAKASIFVFDNVFSGQSTPPAGPGPWTEANFQDISPGTVQLTVTNVGLSTGEFISGLYFNLNPADNVNNLQLTLVGSHGSFTLPTISQGEDGFKADGDGKYDVLLSFSTSSGNTFTANDSLTYKITGISNLTAADFNYLSSPAGGSGPFYLAAHVQGTPPNNGQSCWIQPNLGPVEAPEPSSGWLFVIGGASLCLARLRRAAS